MPLLQLLAVCCWQLAGAVLTILISSASSACLCLPLPLPLPLLLLQPSVGWWP
jgi:hypothetical protein